MKVLKYTLCLEVNTGTAEMPCFIQKFYPKTIQYSEANEEIAKSEAYNGEYTIEDNGEPDPEPTEQEQLRADVDFLLAMGGVL